VDALRLQHLQRQAQSLLQALVAHRAVPTAAGATPAAGSPDAGGAARSQSPALREDGSAAFTAGGSAGGNGGLSAGVTPASGSASPGPGVNGRRGAQLMATAGLGPGSPLVGLQLTPQERANRQENVASLQQLYPQQRQQQLSPGRGSSTPAASGGTTNEATEFSPPRTQAAARPLSLGAGAEVGDRQGGAAASGAGGEPSWRADDSAFAMVQHLLLNNQQVRELRHESGVCFRRTEPLGRCRHCRLAEVNGNKKRTVALSPVGGGHGLAFRSHRAAFWHSP
jgi:hypothetical protein